MKTHPGIQSHVVIVSPGVQSLLVRPEVTGLEWKSAWQAALTLKYLILYFGQLFIHALKCNN